MAFGLFYKPAAMLELKLHPSRTLTILLAMAHLLSLLVLWILPLMPAIQTGAGLLVAANFIFHLRRDALLAARNSIFQLRFEQECSCTYQTRNGTWQEARLLGSSMVTPWLTVLSFSPENSWLARHIVIFPDSADAEALRKMRVLLRWKCANAGRA